MPELLSSSVLFYLLLVATGLAAGFINTLAGGGSNLTVPVLLLMGLPADVANATNRVGVVLQSVVGVSGFRHHGKLDTSDAAAILGLTCVGGVAGAVCASYLPNAVLKPVLLLTMVAMALVILLRPTTIALPPDTVARRVGRRPQAWLGLLGAGFYGGFVQAGSGFVLIAAIAGTLHYDLVRSNALKMLCTLALTLFALVVFIARDQVRWLPGLVLAGGMMAGSWCSVRLAIRASQASLRRFLFAMTLLACGAALIH